MSNVLNWTMSRGAIFDKDQVYVMGYSGREEGVWIFKWTGQWEKYYVDLIGGGLCLLNNTPDILTMGVAGHIHVNHKDNQSQELVDSSVGKQGLLGVLRHIREIDGKYTFPVNWALFLKGGTTNGASLTMVKLKKPSGI